MGEMTYRALLTTALFSSLSVGAFAVGFAAFADEPEPSRYAEHAHIHEGHVMAVPSERELQDYAVSIHDEAGIIYKDK